ncbi:general transcriptional corepressor trfA [Daphnia magna]|uniref:general transcriptional corepressor trfA n=1 Tax=Daphnia magna TaxID=35525 RepID=UPI001E1BB00B|nr:general transcriptional corepressor trfA [Daphnia magna]
MENGNGIDSCNKAEVNSEKKAETIVIMALEEGKPASDYGVADDKLKMCTVDNDNDSLPNQNAELLEAVTAEENVELKDLPIEKTTNEEVKQNGDVAESANNVLTIKVEPKPIETVEEKPLSPPPEKMSVEASEEKAKEAPVEEAKQEMIEEEMQDENDKKNLGDLEMEDQQSSTSSSPSALHIHLDEEDKDESLNDKDKETVDPSLPLISNVVSLSSIASSSSSLTPPPPTHFHHSPSTQPPSPTPSAESGNSSVRRTTLRFKRGIEISFDVDQNGQPVTVNNHETAAMPSASSEEPRQKRGRIEDEDEEDTNQPDVSELDAEGTNNVLSSVQKDIRTLRFMAKQKEKEWNYILKLMKVKEELQAKLMRRREVLKITSSSSRKIQPNSSQIHTVAQTHIQPQQQSGAANLQTLINHSLNAMMGKSSGSSKSIMSNSPGHVTITSERSDLANDDVTVVGGSTSGGRNVSSNNGNYLRTSGGGEVPKCQGCNERVAQFVCAGCSSQWYCSRECQVAAWEEHSEHCVG